MLDVFVAEVHFEILDVHLSSTEIMIISFPIIQLF